MLTSLILLVVLPLYTILAGMVSIPYSAVTREPSLIYRLGRLGARLGFAIAGIRVRVHGRGNPSSRPHCIYMMNHASNLDVPAVFIHLPGEVRTLVKKELFRLPVLGMAMKMGGFVPVDRANREAAIESVREAAKVAREGASFLIAPEGTRSRTGAMLPFKKGAFHMAIESGLPIHPISVKGAFELMPPGGFAIRSGTIDVVFHEPVPTCGLRLEDRGWLMQEVWNRIAAALPDDPPVKS